MKWIGWTILGIIIIIVIGGVGFGITMLFRPAQVIEKVTNPDRIIYTYEWFFNTLASIKSYESQVIVANQSVETFKEDHKDNLSSYANSTELSRLREVQRGLQNQLISTINSYNAQAKNLSRGIFKDWRLPGEIQYAVSLDRFEIKYID
jgi:hypothetical protein